MDTGRYLAGAEDWAYLREGITIDTDFGGLVHYTTDVAEDFVLLERPGRDVVISLPVGPPSR